ncbi:MAG: hypothetical protein ACT4PZ_01165 [Panacagrimonas sp.]
MLRPSPGELLRGIRLGLEESVLPVVPAGAAERQLKAALHALRRLEHSSDRTSWGLADDIADLEETAKALLETALGSSAGPQRERYVDLLGKMDGSDESAAIAGLYTDPRTAALAARSHSLQGLIADLDQTLRADTETRAAIRDQLRADLTALYRRMLERERVQLGLER